MLDWKGYETLLAFVEERLEEFERIGRDRKKELETLAEKIQSRLTGDDPVEIIFICTHNSRRSQMSQLWSQLAAGYYGVERVCCYSGGTEATAFHPQAVKTMKESGFQIRVQIPGANPVYRVRFPGAGKDDRVFSKKYTDPPNPARGYIAVMTCSDADEACPIVVGAESRYAIRYEDPRVFDGTDGEREGYAERNRQIAREMLCLLSLVAAAP